MNKLCSSDLFCPTTSYLTTHSHNWCAPLVSSIFLMGRKKTLNSMPLVYSYICIHFERIMCSVSNNSVRIHIQLHPPHTYIYCFWDKYHHYLLACFFVTESCIIIRKLWKGSACNNRQEREVLTSVLQILSHFHDKPGSFHLCRDPITRSNVFIWLNLFAAWSSLKLHWNSPSLNERQSKRAAGVHHRLADEDFFSFSVLRL